MTLPHLPTRPVETLDPRIPEKIDCPVWKNLELVRRANRISQAEMARRMGVDPMTYYRYRTQGVIPPWDRVVKAAHEFQVEPHWFYTQNFARWVKEGIRA